MRIIIFLFLIFIHPFCVLSQTKGEYQFKIYQCKNKNLFHNKKKSKLILVFNKDNTYSLIDYYKDDTVFFSYMGVYSVHSDTIKMDGDENSGYIINKNSYIIPYKKEKRNELIYFKKSKCKQLLFLSDDDEKLLIKAGCIISKDAVYVQEKDIGE